MLLVQYVVQKLGQILIRLFFCSLSDFCFKMMDFLKAEIIIGLTEIKTMHQKHISGHIHSSQGIQHNRPNILLLGRVAQSVTCLATDACLTADSGVVSSISVRSHSFVEIDHEMISTVILLPSADSFKKGCCQLQAKVCARITG